MISKLHVGETMVAVVLDASDMDFGVEPVSKKEDPLQVLMMRRKKSDVVGKHIHAFMPRQTSSRQKALVLISGSIDVIVCDESGTEGGTYTLLPGQCLYLVAGGYRLEMGEDSVFYEFKNGPHVEDKVPLQ